MLVSTLARVAVSLSLLGSSVAYNVEDLQKRDTTPSQQRLAYYGATGMTVSWNTQSQLSNPSVKYGLSASALSSSADSSESVTYPTSTTYNNHVHITGLQADTVYYYQVENDLNVYSFKTAKEAGADDEFSFGVVVDMGTMGNLGLSTTSGDGDALAAGEHTTIESITSALDGLDFVLHPGDIAYADYWLKEEYQGYLPNTTIAGGIQVYENILNAFFDQIQPITSVKPYMVSVGNHEADCDNGGYKTWTDAICSPGQTNYTGYLNHWRMSAEPSGGLDPLWYSYDYGLVHFVTISSETDFPNGISVPEPKAPDGDQFGPYPNAQLDWLVNDLKNVDRSKTPWVFVYTHRPWYVAGEDCPNCQEAWEATLNEYNVDIVIQGHVHNYERIAPIATGGVIDPNGLNNPSAPWYILNGIAGHYDGQDPLVYPLPEYVDFAQDTAYGWSKFTVHNCTHLTHEFIASGNSTVLDSATLFKNRTCPQNSLSSSVSPASTTIASSSASFHSGVSNTTAATSATSTVTNESTTIVTITSCADNKCSETTVPATWGPTTVTENGVATEYTTWCPETATAASSVVPTSIKVAGTTTGTLSVSTVESSSSDKSTISPASVTTANSGNKLSIQNILVACLALLAF